jgi:hypothetical protein
MESSTSAAPAEKSLSEVEEEISKLVGQRIMSPRPYVERDTPRPQIERDTSRAQIERAPDIERNHIFSGATNFKFDRGPSKT